MNLNKKTLALFSFLTLLAYTGCEDKDDDNAVAEIEVPATFTFQSIFDDLSSISYSGQVVRNLLINDIKTQMGTDAGSKNPATLLSMMANDNASRAILLASGKSTVQTKYHDISTSHLNDRLDAVSSITIPGYDTDAKTLVVGMLNEAAASGKTRASGIRLDQMVQKTMWGAISYWQATSKYMTKIPNDDNSVAVTGKNNTEMEHHWDESFGYFGAALDYNTAYDDGTRKSGPSVDSNSDGKLDFKKEVNMGWAVTAAKRDLCSSCGNYDYTKTIFDAYLEGRTLIVNQAPLAEIIVQRDIIMETWEKVVAAVTQHYINDVAADIAAIISTGDATVTPVSAATADYENHWGEMRGYAHGLLYNSLSKVPSSSVSRILALMGTVPVYPSNGNFDAMQSYHDVLKGAEMKAIFKQSFGFTDADIANY